VRGPLFSSLLLHAAVLGWALFTIQTQSELRMPEPEPIAVDLISVGELTKLRQGVRTAKELEAEAKPTPKPDSAKKEAPKPTPVAAAPAPPEPPTPPAPKEEVKPPEPKSEPVAPPPAPAREEQERLEAMLKEQEQERLAEEQKKQEEARRAEEQKKQEEARRAEEQKKQEEARRAEELRRAEEERKQAELKKKLEEEKRRKEAELKKKREEERKRKEAEARKKFDAEKIAALLNKVPDRGAPPPASDPTDPTRRKGPSLGAPEGRDKELSVSELAVLQQIIKSCVQEKWNISGGGEDAMNTEIKLRLQFSPDGRFSAPPQVTNQQHTAYFLAASEGAMRAAQACEPYPLPPEKYYAWRDVLMTFRLRDMLR